MSILKKLMCLCLLFTSGEIIAENTRQALSFTRDVRPLLSDRCYKCHGPGTQKAKLRLDQRESALSVIDLKDPDESDLIHYITTDDPEERMPPRKGGTPPLTKDEIKILQTWVRQGAKFERHWAYETPQKAPVPEGKHAVDFFIQEELAQYGLKLNPPADPAVLLRRLSLDLIGLPPTIEEVTSFTKSVKKGWKNAYVTEVDRLLASPHFGEKWARQWLDLARYADSNGYQHDNLRTMWPYRDWVIKALNTDMPFDQFTIEQLAGDLLENPTQDQLIATAFHRNTPTNFSGGSKVDEERVAVLMDRVNVTGQVWLGTTMECAACHDHKFDPVTQRDYYALYAFFNRSPQEFQQISETHFRKIFTGPSIEVPLEKEMQSQYETLRIEQEQLSKEIESLKPQVLADQPAWEARFKRQFPQNRYARHQLPQNFLSAPRYVRIPPARRTQKQKEAVRYLLLADHELTFKAMKHLHEVNDKLSRQSPPTVHIMGDAENPPPTHILERGSYLSPGEKVTANGIAAFHPFEENLPQNRLGLAEWLVDERNPLVARVTVNRWWAELFGRGLVVTMDDFGMQSAPPTHPELLDWLAVDFVEQGWSLKRFLRHIVMSETYRQSAEISEESIARDPDNRLFSRAPRYRLSAELIRDNALAIAGLLSQKMYGPPIYPFQPEGLWLEIRGADEKLYPTSKGEDQHRRGLYTILRRGNPHPSLLNFDATDRSLCVVQRPRTNTPLQALTLLNDPIYVAAARHFAKAIRGIEGHQHLKARWAFRRAVSRDPSEAELNVLLKQYKLDKTWFNVAQMLLNLDEVICK